MKNQILSGKCTAIDIGYFTIMVPQELMHFLMKGRLKPSADLLESLSKEYDKDTEKVEEQPKEKIKTNKKIAEETEMDLPEPSGKRDTIPYL